MANNMIENLLGLGLGLGQPEGPKAHEQMDALIGQNEIQEMLKQISPQESNWEESMMSIDSNLNAGSSYETDPEILGKHSTLLDYLSSLAISDPNAQLGAITPELEAKMANIAKFPSSESKGVMRYTAPITQDNGSIRKESRSMQHWLQDYDYLYNRTALSKP